MQSSAFTFEADDGYALHVHKWTPDPGVTPRAVVHIAHGMAEHGARYSRLAEALTARGYVVYANDHRGHGKTARTEAEVGFFAASNGWTRVLRDLHQIVTREREDNPGLPLVLLGHSMGSFMTQQFIYQYGDVLRGAALSGSNGSPNLLAQAGRALARIERFRLGERGRSALLNSLSFDDFNKPFRPNRTKFDWLSRDNAEVDKYIADPRCGFIVTTSMFVDLVDALGEIARPQNHARIRKTLPIYVASGSDDPVGEQTRGVGRLLDAYTAAGLKNVTRKIYPGARHEIFNETNRDEVTSDFIRWLDETTA